MRIEHQTFGSAPGAAPAVDDGVNNMVLGESGPSVSLIGRPIFASYRGHIIARTISGLVLKLPHAAPIYFFPRADVRLDLLGASPTMGLFDECGVANFYDVVLPGSIIIDGAMSFAMPDSSLAEIVDHIGFDSGHEKGCEVVLG
ncbi:MAG: DUF427 domain-containing protein [Hyphomicrobiaceae bacterium]|nr:DUF427 domain-containing protein [Hyphomicrobiaceae bacterium]